MNNNTLNLMSRIQVKLNKGDINLIEEFAGRKRAVMFKLALSSVSTVALGIVAAKLEKLL